MAQDAGRPTPSRTLVPGPEEGGQAHGPGRHRRPAARHAARRARPDHRLHRAADHRQRPRRPGAPVLGGHRLHAGLDRRDPAVGQARRPVRAQEALPDRHRHLPRRLRAVRHRPEHAAAHRLPRPPGARRRRADGAVDGDRRRHRPAARTRQVPGPVRRGLRRDQRRSGRCSAASSPTTSAGAGSSTSTCPIGVVALLVIAAVLHIPVRAGPGTPSTTSAPSSSPPSPPAWSWSPRSAAPPGPGARRRSSGSPCSAPSLLVAFVHVERRAAEPVLPLKLFRIRTFTLVAGHQLRRRLRDVRRDDLPADVPPGRAGRLADPVRRAHAADGARHAAHLDRLRPDRQPHRPLEGLPDRWAPASPRSACSCCTSSTETSSTWRDERLLLRLRRRARPGHAGAGARRAERRRLRGPRRRHLRRDLLPLHRRLVRRRHLRHDLHQPARRQARRRARRARRCRPASAPAGWRPTRAPSPNCRRRCARPCSTRTRPPSPTSSCTPPRSSCSPSSSPGSSRRTSCAARSPRPTPPRPSPRNPVERSSYDEVRPGPVGARLAARAAATSTRRSPSGPGYDLLPAASWLLLRIRRHGTVEPARARRHTPRTAARDHRRRPAGRGARAWPAATGCDWSSPTRAPRPP